MAQEAESASGDAPPEAAAQAEEAPAGDSPSEKPKAPAQKPGTIGEQLAAEGLIVEPEDGQGVEGEKITLSDLSIRIDKIAGKFDLTKEMINGVNERMGDIVERVGDLRRMVLDREKSSTQMEANFEKVHTIVKELDPEVIIRMFEKFTDKIGKQNAYLEKMRTNLDLLAQRVKELETKMSSIKGFENLVEVHTKIMDGMKQIRSNKSYTDRMASKVESIFAELKSNLSAVRNEREMITQVAELTDKLMKELDSLQIKFAEDTVRKKEFEAIKETIIKEAKGISPKIFSRLKQKVGALEMEVKEIEDLHAEKKKVKALLDQINDDFDSKKLSQELYDQSKVACETKIKQIETIIARKTAQIQKGNRTLDKVSSLKQKLSQVKNQRRKLLKKVAQKPKFVPVKSKTPQHTPAQPAATKKDHKGLVSVLHRTLPSHPFNLHNGGTIHSLSELKHKLKEIDDSTFLHHVNEHKNDFATWIHNSMGHVELAHQIGQAKTKDAILRALEPHVPLLGKSRPEPKEQPNRPLLPEIQPPMDRKMEKGLFDKLKKKIGLVKSASPIENPPAEPAPAVQEDTKKEQSAPAPKLEVPQKVLDPEENKLVNKFLLQKGLNQLSATNRMVLVLHTMKGMSLQEIAQLLETDEGTVKQHLDFARKEVYKFLHKKGIKL